MVVPTEQGGEEEWGAGRVVAPRPARPGPPHAKRACGQRALGACPRARERGGGMTPSPRGLLQTLPGASRARPVHARGLSGSNRGRGARVGAGGRKLLTLSPRHQSPPSNCPREKPRGILFWRPHHCPPQSAPPASNSSQSAAVASWPIAGVPAEPGRPTRADPEGAGSRTSSCRPGSDASRTHAGARRSPRPPAPLRLPRSHKSSASRSAADATVRLNSWPLKTSLVTMPT